MFNITITITSIIFAATTSHCIWYYPLLDFTISTDMIMTYILSDEISSTIILLFATAVTNF